MKELLEIVDTEIHGTLTFLKIMPKLEDCQEGEMEENETTHFLYVRLL